MSSTFSIHRKDRACSAHGPLLAGSFVCAFAAIVLLSCGGQSTTVPTSSTQGPPGTPQALIASDVQGIVNAAALSVNVPITIAVVDRLGNVLAVFDDTGAPATGPGNFGNSEPANDLAVALARTAAFFSNSQAPLSSRTVRFISGVHFPPGVDNAPNAALYGIENTNRGCPLDPSLIPGVLVAKGTLINRTYPPAGLGIITGKPDFNDDYGNAPMAANPGGVPIFKTGLPMGQESPGNFLVGGIGIVADAGALGSELASAVAEYAAFAGVNANAGNGLTPVPVPLPSPGAVLINGVTLPFVNQTTIPAGISASPLTTPNGTYFVSPTDGVIPDANDPDRQGKLLLGPKAGSALTSDDVNHIVANAIATASLTRALIRLPLESRTEMSIAVSDTDGTLLAVYRMWDGTVFSLDVSVAKARNAVYFSSTASTVTTDLPGVPTGTAVTNRTIGFGAQPFFPPGINASNPGPFFSLYKNDVMNPCTQGSQNPAIANPSGIVFFPGSVPLYNSNGAIVGGLGVSGDGVDQDDYVTNGGATGGPSGGTPSSPYYFGAPSAIRANQVVIENVRLPYLNFPRDPTN